MFVCVVVCMMRELNLRRCVYFNMIKVSVKRSIMELHVLSISLVVLQKIEFIVEFQRRHTCCTHHGHLICFVKHVTAILEKYI